MGEFADQNNYKTLTNAKQGNYSYYVHTTTLHVTWAPPEHECVHRQQKASHQHVMLRVVTIHEAISNQHTLT